MDEKKFFDAVRRQRIFGRSINQKQVDGCLRIIRAWEKYGYGLHTGLAYCLATSHHETGRRMQPVRETFANSDAQAIRRLDNAYKAGRLKWVKRPYWRSGWYGRGDVQLTHEGNYKGALCEAVKREFGVNIHANPDLVMRPDISAFILVEGMTRGQTNKADFTGQPLEQFVNREKTDYRNARRTVNPAEKDSYAKIASTAQKFETALREAYGAQFVGPGDVDPMYGGGVNEHVRTVQKQLKARGYELGAVDGKWGKLTRAAVLAFRADVGLEPEAEITDPEFITALTAEDDTRELSVERETATVDDLRKKGSRTIRNADFISWGGLIATAGGLLTGAWEMVERFGGVPDEVGDLVLDNPIVVELAAENAWIAIVLAGATAMWKAYKVKRVRLEDHRTGKHIGR